MNIQAIEACIPHRPRLSLRYIEARTGLALVAPGLLLILALEIYPIIYSIWLTFNEVDIDVDGIFLFYNGVGNWIQMLHDPALAEILINTGLFTFSVVALTFFIAMIIALALNEEFPGRKFCRVVILLPWAIPPVVSGRIWGLIYNAGFGILNTILRAAGLIETNINWLSSPRLSIWAVVFAQVWIQVPVVTLFLIAALQTIPRGLYEAAAIDGASWFKSFIYITLPSIRTIGLMLLILLTIYSFKVFDMIYILTKGYGGTMVWYYNVFIQSFDFRYFGYGATLAYALFIVILILSLLYLKVFPVELDK